MPAIINSDDGVVSGSAGLKTSGANDGILALQNNGTTNVTVTAAGNVGIGTSSPAERLDVSSAAGSTRVQIYETSSSGNSQAVARLRTSGTGPGYWDIGTGNNASGLNGALRFFDNTAAAERARITSGGDFQFNSGYGSVATAYGCRAWVNFNGTGTVAIRASGNVSSITDNGVGDYTVNFTTAMPDANFASQLTQGNTDGTSPPGNLSFGLRSVSTTTCRVNLRDSAGNQTDMPSVNVAIFR